MSDVDLPPDTTKLNMSLIQLMILSTSVALVAATFIANPNAIATITVVVITVADDNGDGDGDDVVVTAASVDPNPFARSKI